MNNKEIYKILVITFCIIILLLLYKSKSYNINYKNTENFRNCHAHYGSRINIHPVCCNQPGLATNTSKICPMNKPMCINYNKGLGNSSAKDGTCQNIDKVYKWESSNGGDDDYYYCPGQNNWRPGEQCFSNSYQY